MPGLPGVRAGRQQLARARDGTCEAPADRAEGRCHSIPMGRQQAGGQDGGICAVHTAAGIPSYPVCVALQWVNWAAIPGPQWYSPHCAAEAFRALIRTTWGGEDPGRGIRSAVGNDHGGTLYPAAVAGTGVLLHIIIDCPGAPRNAALCVLLDWWGCFQPEPGFEAYTDQNGNRVEVIPAIMRQVGQAADTLRVIAEHDTQARGLIRELLRSLDRGWTVEE